MTKFFALPFDVRSTIWQKARFFTCHSNADFVDTEVAES